MTTTTMETDIDPITEATTARGVLIERFEIANEELSAAQRKGSEIAKAIAEGVSAETVDEAAMRKLFKQREDARRAEEIAAARAEAIRQKAVEAEAALTRLIGERNAILREEQLRQYQVDVEANEQQLLSDVRKLLHACEGRIVGDISWVMGGSEALRYYLRIGELTATAQALGVSGPFVLGTSLAENLIRHGIDGDPLAG